MMQVEAPYHYIHEYYQHAHRKLERLPDMASFLRSSLRRVHGKNVLNVGCGPQAYDHLLNLGTAPREYVGLDVNRNTFEFLHRSRCQSLVRARARAHDMGTHIEFVCGDVLECDAMMARRFDVVMGIGVFATFYGQRFEQLTSVLRDALCDGGRLLKVSWHRPHRSPEETARKLQYRYDSTIEPSPEELVAGFERAGFRLCEEEFFQCDPETHGWDLVQMCLFEKT